MPAHGGKPKQQDKDALQSYRELQSRVISEGFFTMSYHCYYKNTDYSPYKTFEVSLVWFEIPVDDAIIVEILQSKYCLRKVHPGHIHRQGTHVLQKGGTVSTCKDQWSVVTDVLEINTQETFFKVYCFQLQHCPLKKTQPLTFNILHDHAQVPSCLKGAVHGHHKRVLSKGKDVSLHKGLLYLIPQNQVLFVDLFHGKALLGFLVANQINRSVE